MGMASSASSSLSSSLSSPLPRRRDGIASTLNQHYPTGAPTTAVTTTTEEILLLQRLLSPTSIAPSASITLPQLLNTPRGGDLSSLFVNIQQRQQQLQNQQAAAAAAMSTMKECAPQERPQHPATTTTGCSSGHTPPTGTTFKKGCKMFSSPLPLPPPLPTVSKTAAQLQQIMAARKMMKAPSGNK